MPLTASGRKVLRKLQRQYGKEKGTRIFYASIRMRKPGTEKWHRKRRQKRRKHKK